MNRISLNHITELDKNEIFVFGSNLEGLHGSGAALLAYRKWGAIWGQGAGLQGQTYAIPTMHGGVDVIRPYVDEFILFAVEHPELTFMVTEIGCGIAGFSIEEVAPLFADTIGLNNVYLPERFHSLLIKILPCTMEKKIRELYKIRKRNSDDSSIKSLLHRRKQALDEQFTFTDENMAMLKRLDTVLRTSSLAVADKVEHIRREATEKIETDSFVEDFEMEAFIRANVDEYSDATPVDILEIIDAVWLGNNLYPLGTYPTEDQDRRLKKLDDDESRYITNTPLDKLNFCWTFQRLIEHSPYALVDILRINEFWNEVQIRYQNFVTIN